MHDFSRRGLLKVTAAAGVGAAVLPGIAAVADPVASAATIGAGSATAKLTGRIVRAERRRLRHCEPGLGRAVRSHNVFQYEQSIPPASV